MISGASILAALAMRIAVSCRADDIQERLRESSESAYTLFFVSVAIVATAVLFVGVTRYRRRTATLAALVLAHPGWWMPSDMSDCGFILFWTSVTFTNVIVLMTVLLARRWWRDQRRSA
jgi:hypothetical protein